MDWDVHWGYDLAFDPWPNGSMARSQRVVGLGLGRKSHSLFGFGGHFFVSKKLGDFFWARPGSEENMVLGFPAELLKRILGKQRLEK